MNLTLTNLPMIIHSSILPTCVIYHEHEQGVLYMLFVQPAARLINRMPQPAALLINQTGDQQPSISMYNYMHAAIRQGAECAKLVCGSSDLYREFE